jgi:hypothetical protein
LAFLFTAAPNHCFPYLPRFPLALHPNLVSKPS